MPPPIPGGGAGAAANPIGAAEAAGAGAPPIRSASRSMSPEGAAGAAGAAATEALGLDLEGDSLPSPPAARAASAFLLGLRSFLVKAGMCSSTSPQIEVNWSNEAYSTERCCSSRLIEVE